MQERRMSMKDREVPFIRDMFEQIAPRYDFLNRLLSLRRDVLWRRMLVDALHLAPDAMILDAACGTGDVMIELMGRSHGKTAVGSLCGVVGIDFSPEMLALAKLKLKTAPTVPPATGLAAADIFHLPFGPDCFDAVTIAFGIRNIQNKVDALKEFWQLLKPGGQMAVLELALARQGIAAGFFSGYFNRLLPMVGRFFSHHRFAYTYLPASMAQFPAPSEFAATMRRAGFIHVRYRPLTLGICHLFVGEKGKTPSV